MMNMKYSALILATSLLTAPAWVMAEQTASEPPVAAAQASHQHKMQHGSYDGHKGHGNSYQRGHKQQMSPEHFETYLNKHLEKLETPELKAQFIKASQARLNAKIEQGQLRTLMAEHKAQKITDKALKDATLEKIAADHKLKQLRIKQLQDLLTKAKK
ncbi:hypothetical protein [Oceanisphaera sp. W20_SRM_FM3]|uniref:hypothetical protein n=1 Tax=Oceanisphaera sp. W20_SRM_FM3 TaxID=3240267 RepID=UPI003F9C9FE7